MQKYNIIAVINKTTNPAHILINNVELKQRFNFIKSKNCDNDLWVFRHVANERK